MTFSQALIMAGISIFLPSPAGAWTTNRLRGSLAANSFGGVRDPFDDDVAPPVWHHTSNVSVELFEGCSVKKQSGWVSEHISRASTRKHDNALEVANAGYHGKVSPCGSDTIPLYEFKSTSDTAATTCCPKQSLKCAGCARFVSGVCEKCAGGFLKTSRGCIACLDTAAWVNEQGLSCTQLAASDCSDAKFRGLSSNEACCKCRGGHVSPTSFTYEDRVFAIGEPIKLSPIPRVTDRYAVDEDCALSSVNLTIDGGTGEISYGEGLSIPVEPFEVTCKVTAHQSVAHGASFTAHVTIKVDWLSFGQSVLVFPLRGSSSRTFKLKTAPGQWEESRIDCSPKAEWLALSAANVLARTGTPTAGAVSLVHDTYEHQSGAVCQVSSMLQPASGGSPKRKSAKFIAVSPTPIQRLEYPTVAVAMVVGEKPPPLELKPGALSELMPSKYEVACDNSAFDFDQLLGVGFFNGDPFLEIAGNGQIVLSTTHSFARMFDFMAHDGARMLKVVLSCKVFGIFAEATGFAPATAALQVEIRDNTCWVPERLEGTLTALKQMGLGAAAPRDASSCRHLCRQKKSCSHVAFKNGVCFEVKRNPNAESVDAHAKIPDCSDSASCRLVKSNDWYKSGVYCPQGRDIVRNTIVYLKKGETFQETIFLYQGGNCQEGNWALQRASASDFVQAEKGYFELHGEHLECQSDELDFAQLPCGQPQNITDEDALIQPLIFDDPATNLSADYWLHPCDCLPSAWGRHPPVDPASFQTIPPGSTKDFIPPPFTIVSGEFVCPAHALLPKIGIIFESDEEAMDLQSCESKCKDHEDCDFFWHGMQHAANTCRLYSSCDNLVREPGLSGSLMALPRDEACVVSNPTACWATSMRRAALMSSKAQSFWYWHLHSQCDLMLLMGGSGVQSCGKPMYRNPKSHSWRHKRLLPKQFEHGTTVAVSCWEERFAGMRGSEPVAKDTLTCVGGKWFNSVDQLGLGTFDCQSCVQVASAGYAASEQRSEQELYYFSKTELSLYSVVSLAKERKVSCMEPKQPPVIPPDPVVPDQASTWMTPAEMPEHSRTAYYVHDTTHRNHRFKISTQAKHGGWRKLYKFYAFSSAKAGTQRYYVNTAGSGHTARDSITQKPPCCGFTNKFSFYAYPNMVTGTKKFYLSTYRNDRFKVSLSRQCCGWRDVFTFYAYPNDRVGGKPGLVAHFRSEDANAEWKSSVGSYVASPIAGSVDAYEARGNGAASNVRYLQGAAESKYDFGQVLFDEFTVCSVTRYTTVMHPKRILVSSVSNWIQGHWEGNVGIVHGQPKWQTVSRRNHRSIDWVTVCSSPQASYVIVDGDNIGLRPSGTAKYPWQKLQINTRYNEFSDWAVMEVMVWDRKLSESEMRDASKYLMRKLAHKVSLGGCRLEVFNPPELQRSYETTIHNQAPGQGVYSISMLDQTGGDWCAANQRASAWMEMDLSEVKKVAGVVIQARQARRDHYVISFRVQYRYGIDGSWRTVPIRFTGLNGKSTSQKRQVFFTAPVEARFIRLTDIEYGGHLCLRSGVILCHTSMDNEMGLLESGSCSSEYRIEALEDSPPSSRHLLFQSAGVEECVALSHSGSYETAVHQKCQVDSAQQLIPAAEIPSLFTRLHASPTAAVRLAQGLKVEFYFGLNQLARDRCTIPDLEFKQPGHTRVEPQVEKTRGSRWGGLPENDWMVSQWTGFLVIKAAGNYTFWLKADDSMRLILDGSNVAATPCRRANAEVHVVKSLRPGLIPILVQHVELSGHAGIRLQYSGPDTTGKREVVPSAAFAHLDDSPVDDDRRRGCIGNTAISGIAGTAFAPSALTGVGVKCSFAAVIHDEEPVERLTTRRASGSWPNWWEDLESIKVECGPGRVLKNMEPVFVNGMQKIRYTCGVVAGLGACLPMWTDQMDARRFANDAHSRKVLSRLLMGCNSDSLLKSMHFEYSIGGRWARFKYSCCKAGGAPTVIQSLGLDPLLFGSLEGRFCPAGRGTSGRYNYVQQPFAPWQSVPQPATLQFDNLRGKWCIANKCEGGSTPSTSPLGVKLLGFDVAPVSDFDGDFQPLGAGATSMGIDGEVANLNKKARKVAPKRPRPPKKPTLETFEPEMPRYSDKCVGYGDLWKKITETTLNDEGEQVPTMNKFETEEDQNGQYQDTHPCDVAGSAGGTKGRMGGGDGSSTREQMPYDELDGCHTRDINRELVDAKADIFAARFEQGFGMAKEVADVICSVIPDMNIAPFGIGVAINPSEICTQAKDLGIKATERVTPFIGLLEAEKKFDMENEGWSDCSPLQTNFARLFCDVHCVRDAVIRGDRTIIRNLKRATDVTNKNMDKLSSWIVESARVDAGWLGELVEWTGDSNWESLEAIKTKLGVGDSKTMFVNVRRGLATLRDEISDLAQESSFSAFAAATARGALAEFAQTFEKPSHNNSQAMLQSLLKLSATMKATTSEHSKADGVARQVERGARRMQEVARLQRRALGVYMQYSNVSRTVLAEMRGQGRERHAMLIAMDRIWWELRDGFDAYIDVAQDEVDAFDIAFGSMKRYEQCAIDFSTLLSEYKRTMALTDRAHRKLKMTWRRNENLVGELASVVVDGEAFGTFFKDGGCHSNLARETVMQVRFALGGMKMLIHRFKAAGLKQPDVSTLAQAVVRLQQSYADSVKQYECHDFEDLGNDIAADGRDQP